MLSERIKKYCTNGRTIKEICEHFNEYRTGAVLHECMRKLVNSGRLVMIESLGIKKYYTEE